MAARTGGFLALVALVPATALAQTPSPAASAAAAAAVLSRGAASAAPAADEAPVSAGAAPAVAEPEKPAKVIPATGYGWSEPKKATTTPRSKGHTKVRAVHRPGAPDATMPGFEVRGDGSTRLFLELSKPVVYQTKMQKGEVVYVLKDAYVGRRNNYNPLVTVHFNTPVTRARLEPHGNDLWFVVHLRAKVEPQVSMDASKEGGAMMRIDFPKGDYLPKGHESVSAKSDQAGGDKTPDEKTDDKADEPEAPPPAIQLH